MRGVESGDVTMKLSHLSKSRDKLTTTTTGLDDFDMGDALAELDAAVNSLQDLVLC